MGGGFLEGFFFLILSVFLFCLWIFFSDLITFEGADGG